MTRRCAVSAPRCGYVGPDIQLHHLLGRDELGDRVQPELLVALCSPDCHQLGVHRVLAGAGLDHPMRPTPGVLVGRIAATLGFLAIDRCGDVVLPGELVAGIGDVLGSIGRDLRGAEGIDAR